MKLRLVTLLMIITIGDAIDDATGKAFDDTIEDAI